MHSTATLRPPRPGLALLAAFLGWMFDGMEMGIFPIVANPALKAMALARGITGAEDIKAYVDGGMGLVTCFFLLGAAAGGLVFGWIGDRFGRVKAMTWSILAYSIFTGLCFFAHAPWHLAVFRFIAALGMGGEWALGVALVMECWPEGRRPLLAGAIGAAANLGYTLVALAGMAWRITEDSWRSFMLIGAIPAGLTFFIRLFVPESEKWIHSVEKRQASPVREIFGPALLRKTLLAIAFASVPLIVTWGTVQWIPLWANQMADGIDPLAKSKAQLACYIGATLGAGLAPLVGDWLGRRLTYFLLCLLSWGAAQALFLGCDDLSPAFFLATGIVGLFSAAFYGWLPLYLPELFPTRARATGQGLAFNFGRILAAVGALKMPMILAALGGSYPHAGSAIVWVYAAGALLIWLAPETKGRPLPE